MIQDVAVAKALQSITTQLGGLSPRQYEVIGNHLYMVYSCGFDEGSKGVLHAKQIVQYKKGVEVRRYNSAKEAAAIMKVHHKSIERAARGIMKTCKGYIWKYD